MREFTAIGIDLGGTNVRAGRVGEDGCCLSWETEPTVRQPEHVVTQVLDLARRIIDPTVVVIGIGIPGRVDSAKGNVLSGGFVNLAGMSLAQQLTVALDLPVRIDNDANMALIAEHAIGRAKGIDQVAMFTIGTGIGGAVMMDGEIVRGRATAGQFGHLTIDIAGAPCVCGRRGCFETTSSGTALTGLIASHGLPAGTTVQNLLARRPSGDGVAEQILRAWAAPMRAAADSLAAAFDPELILFGGGLGAAACTALDTFPALSPWYQCVIAPASLGDKAGVIGAGLSALRSMGPL